MFSNFKKKIIKKEKKVDTHGPETEKVDTQGAEGVTSQ